MEMYNAIVEVASKKKIDVDAVMGQLEAFHAALSESQRGWNTAHISLPGESLAQAAATATAVVSSAYGAPAIACEVMTETEFLAREGWAPVPDLVSVTEAAQLLGVSRQAVLQRIGSGSLPSTKIGRDHAIPRAGREDGALSESTEERGAPITTARTLTLSEFLLARLDEDEAVARAATGDRWEWWNLEGVDQGWSGQGPDLVAAPGEWYVCDRWCQWAEPSTEDRGAQGVANGYEHLRRETVVGSHGYDSWGIDIERPTADHIARHDPARVLAECAFKVATVEDCVGDLTKDVEFNEQFGIAARARGTLRRMALIYADQEDFREEWRP